MTEDADWIILGSAVMGEVPPHRDKPLLTLVPDATSDEYPIAPEGSSVAAHAATMRALGIEYAGANGRGGTWRCANPGHEDEHPSYDVIVGENGMVVGTCTPCRDAMGQDEFFAVLVGLGVDFSGDPCEPDDVDWGPAAEARSGSGGKKGKTDYALVAAYDYRFFDGSRNFKVRRLEDRNGNGRKTFSPRRWDSDRAEYVGGRGALDNVLRTPLFFERFEEWQGRRSRLYICEGEKPVAALVAKGNAEGKPIFATTFHGGVNGKRMEGWTDAVGAFADLPIWIDLDEAGLNWGEALLAELVSAGVSGGRLVCNDPQGGAWVAKADAFEALNCGEVPVEVTDEIKAMIRALKPAPRVPDKVRSEYLPCWPSSEPRKAAQFFLGEVGLADGEELLLRSVGGSFFAWRGANYTEIAPAILGEKVAQYFDGKKYRVSKDLTKVVNVRKSLLNEIVSALEGLTLSVAGPSHHPELHSMLTAEGGIPFRNGWLDVESGVLEPHRADRFNTWCVPADYEPGEWTPHSTPLWTKFLNSIGFTPDTDHYRVLRQWFGYVLSGRTNVDRAMVLWGPRRAGKGNILHVLSKLVGDAACATNMGAMTRNFGLSQMLGKTLATVDDCKWETYDREVLEKMLTLTAFGEMPIDRKYKDPITARLGVRLMIATNDFPKFKQESNAIAGRLLILPFAVSHYGNEDLDLKQKLESELAGIAKWALGGIADLDANGGRFTVTADQKQFEDRIETEGSEVKLFLSEACEFVPLGRKAARVPVNGPGSLFDSYLEWARTSKRSNFDTLTKREFERGLLEHCGSRVEKKPDRTKGNQVCFFGLRLRPEFQDVPPLRFN